MSGLPDIALSIRQPWAWAVVAGVKDVENRSQHAVAKGGMQARRIAVHASKGMTRDEYESAAMFMRSIGVECPPPAELQRGGIIGAVDVVDVVRASSSPWFFGPRGLLLRKATTCDFIPVSGELGYFRWMPGRPECAAPLARWMLKYGEVYPATNASPLQARML